MYLSELQPYLEKEETEHKDAPVCSAYCYIENRLDALDYPGTLAKGLPVGLGLIEGSGLQRLNKNYFFKVDWRYPLGRSEQRVSKLKIKDDCKDILF